MSTAYTAIGGGALKDQWPTDWGTFGTLGIYADQDFDADDGTRWLTSSGDSLTSGLITKAAITVGGGVGSYASYLLPKTDTCTPAPRYYAMVFDARGTPRQEFFSDRHLRTSLGNSISELQWALDNQQHITPQPDGAPTTTAMNAAINAAVLNAALNQDYVIGSYSSLAAAYAAMPATGATLVINQATSVPSNVTAPSYVTTKVTGKGYFNLTTGATLTLTGPLEANPTKIFYNALSGQGTVSFAGNYVTKEVYSEWWGAIANETTDCLLPINAAMAAFYLVRFMLAGYRVSGPISVPNRVSLYGPQVANTQTYARLIGNGSLGFSGNNVVVVSASGQYNSFQNLAIYAKNISNASSFVPFSITGLSETSFIKNVAAYIQNSSVSRMFFFDTFGPLIIETLNIDIIDGANSITNEPLYINAPAGVIFRDLNYHLPNIAAKGIKITTGLYGELSGLQIETHPTSASEPSLTLTPAYGISLRDSRLNTSVVNSTGIKIMVTQPTVDFAGYNLDNITIDPTGGGTWNKLVVLEDALGATRSWSSTNLNTNASSQLPQRIIRFTPSEQIFNGVQTSYSPHTFRDTFLFSDILTNGTIVIPFNPRVGTGTFGAGHVLIAVNGRVNVAGTSNSALIWMDLVDLAGSGITATFTWIVGTSLANWNASYAGGEITLTNKNANTMKETVVRLDHSTTGLWPA